MVGGQNYWRLLTKDFSFFLFPDCANNSSYIYTHLNGVGTKGTGRAVNAPGHQINLANYVPPLERKRNLRAHNLVMLQGAVVASYATDSSSPNFHD